MLWVVGGGLIIASIELFDTDPKSSLSQTEDLDGSDARSQINHHLVSLILSLSSCVLYVVADIAIFHFGFDESWLRPVLICAWAAAVAAVPLTVLVGSTAVPVGLRSENVLLKIVGWTLWSFTLMLGALLIFNKYFVQEAPGSNMTATNDSSQQQGQGEKLVGKVLRLGFSNAGSWLLSTSSLGLLAQLTFALPRFAAMHKVVSCDARSLQNLCARCEHICSIMVDACSSLVHICQANQLDADDHSDGDQRQTDKAPATLLHTFLRWAMRSHWMNAVMIVVRCIDLVLSDLRQRSATSRVGGMYAYG